MPPLRGSRNDVSVVLPNREPSVMIWLMAKLDPEKINVIVATDCGSTTTKAILIEKIDGHYHQTYRGEAPTTVEEPVADVTIGVANALTELQELAGRRLIDEHGHIVRPANGP